jgi:hypothetical protein
MLVEELKEYRPRQMARLVTLELSDKEHPEPV